LPDYLQTPSQSIEVLLLAGAPQASSGLPFGIRKVENEDVLLLGGYVDDKGNVHEQVTLAPLTGHDEYAVANLRDRACAAVVTTSLLSRCVKRIGTFDRVDNALIRDLLVADRDYLLARLRSLSFGPRVDCVLQCSDPECGALMDLALDLDDVEFERKPVRQRYFDTEVATACGELSVGVRLPNGGDQEVSATLFPNEAAAIEELLRRCVSKPDDAALPGQDFVQALSPTVRGELEERISALAPRAEIDFEGSCPECGRALHSDIDVSAIFLDELASGLDSLERDVHVLAWHYHWSEDEILSMTRPRRKRYVALVQKEIDRLNQVW